MRELTSKEHSLSKSKEIGEGAEKSVSNIITTYELREYRESDKFELNKQASKNTHFLKIVEEIS